MPDSVFKTVVVTDPVATQDPSQEISDGNNDVATPPPLLDNPNPSLSEYMEENSQPYSNEYFETGTPYHYLPGETQKSLDAIDKYVQMEISDRHWKDSLTNYNTIIENLSFELGLDRDMPTAERIERISAYAENILKLEGVDEIRQQLKKSLRKARTRQEASDMVLKAIGRKIL